MAEDANPDVQLFQTQLFQTWTFAGVKFLAVNRGPRDGWHIIDEVGRNYGSWQRVETYRERQSKYAVGIGSVGHSRLQVVSVK